MKHPFKKLFTVVSALLATFLFISTINFNGQFVGSDAAIAKGQTIFIRNDGGASGGWLEAGAKLKLNCQDTGGGWHEQILSTVQTITNSDSYIFKFTLPNDWNTPSTFQILRMDSSGNTQWNYSNTISVTGSTHNLFALDSTVGDNGHFSESPASISKITLSQTTGGTISCNVKDSTTDVPSGSYVYSDHWFQLKAVPSNGYNFEKWQANGEDFSSGGTDNPITLQGVLGDPIFSAVFSAKTSTVTLNRNGGTGGTESVVATYGQPMPSADMPTRVGYTFNGYDDAKEGGTKYYTSDGASARNWDKEATKSTLYAQWIVHSYNVSFNLDGGNIEGQTSVDSLDLDYGEVGSISSPTKQGYSFKGWLFSVSGGKWGTTSDCSNTVNSTKVFYGEGASKIYFKNLVRDDQGSITLTAQWKANEYQVSFDANGGPTNPDPITVTYDSTYKTLPTPIWAGHTFAGWFTATDGGTEITSSSTVKITANQTLYAHWANKSFTVYFNAGTGATVYPPSKKVSFNSEYGELPTPLKTGYTFNGWFTAQEGGTQITSSTIVELTNDQTLYAHWSPTVYTISFTNESMGATGPESTTVTYKDTTLDSNLIATKNYYTFSGYQVYDEEYSQNIKIINLNNSGVTVLFSSSSYPEGLRYKYVNSLNKWVYTDDVTASPILTGNKNLNINLNPNGGSSSISVIKLDYNSTYKNSLGTPITSSTGGIAIPTKDGYVFDGYYTAINGGDRIIKPALDSSGTIKGFLDPNASLTPFDGDETELDSHTFYAHWTSKTSIVTLDSQGGSGGSSSVTATYNQTMPEITLPTRTGYTFDGYFDAVTGGTQYYTNTGDSAKNWDKTDAEVTLYAHWIANTSTVNFDFNGGSAGSTSITATYDSDMPNITLPKKTYYTFNGYYDALTGGVKYYNADGTSAKKWDKTDAEVTLYAQWVPNEYTVSFNPNGGECDTESKVVTYGQPYGPLPEPTRDGFRFNGWYTGASEGIFIDSNTIYPGRDTLVNTLYAHWAENIPTTYTLDFNGGAASYTALYQLANAGGSSGWYYDITCKSNYKITKADATVPCPLPLPTKAGCEFLGFKGKIKGASESIYVIDRNGFLNPNVNSNTEFDSQTFVAQWSGHYLRVSDSWSVGTQVPLQPNPGVENEFYATNVEFTANQECRGYWYYESSEDWLNVNASSFSPLPQIYSVGTNGGYNAKVITPGFYNVYVNFTNGKYTFEPVGVTIEASINGGEKIALSRSPKDTDLGDALAQWYSDEISLDRYDVVDFYCNGQKLLTYAQDKKGSTDTNVLMFTNNRLEVHNDCETSLYFKTYDKVYACWGNGRTAISGIASGENFYVRDDGNWQKDNAKIAIWFYGYDSSNNGVWSGFAVKAQSEDIRNNPFSPLKIRFEMNNESNGDNASIEYLEVTAPLVNGENVIFTGYNVVRLNPKYDAPSWNTDTENDHVYNQTQGISFNQSNDADRLIVTGNLDGTQSSVSQSSGYTDIDRVNDYASFFNDVCEFCKDGGSHPTELSEVWSTKLEEQFKQMSDHAKSLFTNALSDQTKAAASVERIASLYDYCLMTYHSQLNDNDFAGRFVDENGVTNFPEYRGHSYRITESEDQSVLIIVIAASATLLATSATLLFVLKKKKKTNK